MSIADKLQTILENEQKVYNAGYEKGKSEGGGGGGVNKLAKVVDGTATIELTAEDLAGVTKIRKYAFYYSELTSIEIPNSATSIGAYAFSECRKLNTVNISNSVTSISNNAFYNCKSLTSVIIPDGVTDIGNQAFYGSGLISIVIANSVTNIGSYAIYQCNSLKRVDCSTHTKIPTLQADGIGNYANLQIKVPANLIDEWKNATNWSKLASKIVTEFTNEV